MLMKRIVFMITLLVSVISANAQLMRAEELEKYAENLYGDKWVDVASNLKNDETFTVILPLHKNP